MATPQENKASFIKIYLKNGFSITDAAATIGIDRTTFYYWIRNDKDFKTEFEDARKIEIDERIFEAESAKRALIQGVPILDKEGKRIGWQTPPYYPAIKDELNRFAKDHGYGEETIKVDHTSGGKEINFQPIIQIIKPED